MISVSRKILEEVMKQFGILYWNRAPYFDNVTKQTQMTFLLQSE